MKNILDVEKSVYICTERLRELIAIEATQSNFTY